MNQSACPPCGVGVSRRKPHVAHMWSWPACRPVCLPASLTAAALAFVYLRQTNTHTYQEENAAVSAQRGQRAEEAEALARKLVVAKDLAQALEAELKEKTTSLVSELGVC